METAHHDFDIIRELEESLWITGTRFDIKYMDGILTPDFLEFGRSGKIYTREETLSVSSGEIKVNLPLKNFSVHTIAGGVLLATYVSEEVNDQLRISNRSSIWVKSSSGWQLRFHQGTPVN